MFPQTGDMFRWTEQHKHWQAVSSQVRFGTDEVMIILLLKS